MDETSLLIGKNMLTLQLLKTEFLELQIKLDKTLKMIDKIQDNMYELAKEYKEMKEEENGGPGKSI